MDVSFLILENLRDLKELQRLEMHLLLEGRTKIILFSKIFFWSIDSKDKFSHL